jgi:uncharacterized protein (TIGR00369 family)
MQAAPPLVTAAEFNRLIGAYPWFGRWAGAQAVEITRGGAKVRVAVRPEFLRHGDTVSGPIVMAVADIAMYAATMGVAEAGERAVTADMTMHFLRRPSGAALIAEARIVRQGQRMIVCAVDVFVEGEAESVCHCVGSYAVPAR